MNILYFASVRERVGKGSDEFDLPADIASVSALMDWLAARGENYAHAFADRDLLRVAVDQEIADASRPLAGVREVAFFPPMTGG